MASRKKDDTGTGCLLVIAVFLIIGFVGWLHETTGIPQIVVYLLFGALAILGVWIYLRAEKEALRAIEISNIDSMRGIEFERYLQKLLVHQGYRVTETPGSGDLGVDLVAIRGKEKIAIQAKRYKKKVSRRAISDAVGGMQYYRCNRTMVITNNYFTPDAAKLAQSTDCTLIDRDSLAKWIIQLQNEKVSKA